VDRGVSARVAYWIVVAAVAGLLIAATNAAAGAGWLDFAAGRRKAVRKPPFSLSDTRRGRAVVNARNVVPGRSGLTRVWVGNAGTHRFRSLVLNQTRARTGGISRNLQLTVRDATTRRCLYPAPPQRRRQWATCRGWGPWVGGRALRNVPVAPRNRRYWRPGERHAIEVRWRLTTASPSSDQGRSATFTLLWRARQ
jgi:hypothetical protein